jgi:TPR repeat protein
VKKGLSYLTTASSQGYAEAYLELGLLYKEGKVVKKNIRKANNYFSDAVILGCKEAERYLPENKKK